MVTEIAPPAAWAAAREIGRKSAGVAAPFLLHSWRHLRVRQQEEERDSSPWRRNEVAETSKEIVASAPDGEEATVNDSSAGDPSEDSWRMARMTDARKERVYAKHS